MSGPPQHPRRWGAERPSIEPRYDLVGGTWSRTWLAATSARQKLMREIGALRSAIYNPEIAAKIDFESAVRLV
jgi:hypothetical protein